MKISLEWLNEYLHPHVTADEVETLMTAQGMPIESRADAGAGDVMLDVEVTSNRPDCLSHLGIAREIAAGSARKFLPPTLDMPVTTTGTPATSGNPSSKSEIRNPKSEIPLPLVQNPRTDLCPLYTARVIRGVKVGPSPAWLVRRLLAIGLRSVNNVVDVTNYVLMEMGQPLHAFDLAKLAERRIVVRPAAEGEAFVAIDGSKHRLTASMLVIADAKRPVAVAGVMGGQESEVGPAAVDILLESARFDPLSIRRTSRALKLSSDSSYRFERKIDPNGVDAASRRAAELIVKLAGGTLATGVIRVGAQPAQPRQVTMRVARCHQILGLGIAPSRILELLARLGLTPRLGANAAEIACTIPTFRQDLEQEVDLIEEVARLHGFDQFGVNEKINIVARPMQPDVQARRVLARTLVAHGFHEAVTQTFIAPKMGELFLPAGEQAVRIDESWSDRRKSEPMLRPSLLPSLLVCRKTNQDVGNTHVRLFETAAVWSRSNGKIIERRKLAILADAPAGSGASGLEQGLRGLRGTIEELVEALAGHAHIEFAPQDLPVFAAAAAVKLAGQAIGTMGLLSPSVHRLFDLQSEIVAAELDVLPLLAAYPPARKIQPLARFPGIEGRDLSVVVAQSVTWDQIRHEVLAAAPPLWARLSFLVVYRGKPIPAGQKGVSLRMLFRDPAATLRHDQVDPQVTAVIAKLKATLGAELRA